VPDSSARKHPVDGRHRGVETEEWLGADETAGAERPRVPGHRSHRQEDRPRPQDERQGDRSRPPAERPWPQDERQVRPAERSRPPGDRPWPQDERQVRPAERSRPPADRPWPQDERQVRQGDRPRPPGDRPWPQDERQVRQGDRPRPPADRPWPQDERQVRQGDRPRPPADRPWPQDERQVRPAERSRPPGDRPWPQDGRRGATAGPPWAMDDYPLPSNIAEHHGVSPARVQEAPSGHQRPASLRRSRPVPPLAVVALAICQLAGMAALVRSYQIADTALSTPSEFEWFWLGMILLELPLAGFLIRRVTPGPMRIALLLFYGLVSYAPKLLRSPTAPAYHDEYAHWRATYEILSTGKLFQPNPIIPIIAKYPGLHATTAAVVNASGLTIWQAGTLLLVFFHVALVLGIAMLAQSVGLDNRTASLVAILYCLNSSFLYFDTQYAYESMAITLLVWALVAFVRAIRSQPGEGRAAWSAVTVVLSAGTVITHHLSTFTLILIMTLVSLALSVRWVAKADGWVETAVTAWGLTLVTALTAGAWIHFVAPTTLSYLSPYLGQGFSELLQAASGSGGARQLFGASLSPSWEQKSAYVVPVLALCLAVGGLFLLRARIRSGHLPPGRRRAALLAFALLGLAYFPSNVFILSPSGAEGARRSWAFTWIGLSILVGPAVVWLLDRARRRLPRLGRICLHSWLLIALVVALVGGTAAGVDASYRFPGPFLYGSDARSVTPELVAASEWFKAQFGAGNNVVTDRYTGLIIASFGLQNTAAPSTNFPVWNLFLARPDATIQPAYLLYDFYLSRYMYLIVDARMAYDVPQVGVYFTPNDPLSAQPQGNKSPFYGKLDKFNTTPFAVKVFQSGNYAIYRLNLSSATIPEQSHWSAPSGKLPKGKLVVTP
jgi:hypothetical protein